MWYLIFYCHYQNVEKFSNHAFLNPGRAQLTQYIVTTAHGLLY